MAEPRGPLLSNQRLIAGITVLIIVITIVLFFSFRSCGSGGSKNTVIYSNLDLTDAAKVVTRLKELKIPYEIREKGTAVAVPKDQASQARLGLAEKNLPSGGVVGWEIFNETKMGATDFDRRIQLIRAISGELSRTIRKIEGVSDARVQIVMPETRLFEVTKVPVTASVLLRLNPGSAIKSEQIRGIVHLVASSVENLQPENVTVVDDSGNILSARVVALPQMPAEAVKEEVAPVAANGPVLTKEAEIKPLTEEEKNILKLKAKEEYERQLTASCQKVLNKFSAPNSVIAQVSVEFGKPDKPTKYYTNLRIKNNSEEITAQVKKITVIVLVDKRLDMTSEMKKNIYSTLALAVPYNSSRGDRIVLKKVPFHQAAVSPEDMDREFTAEAASIEKKKPSGPNYALWIASITAAIIIVVIIIGRSRGKREPLYTEDRAISFAPPTAEEAGDAVNQIKDMADRDPEKIAEMLKQWLTEENA